MNKKTIFFLALLTSAGIFFITVGVWTILFNSRSWPAVEAEVIRSEYVVPLDYELNPGYDVHFNFGVNGQTYNSMINMPAEKFPGEKITVYYNPESPETTILTSGELEWHGLGSLVLGLVFLGEVIRRINGLRNKAAGLPVYSDIFPNEDL